MQGPAAAAGTAGALPGQAPTPRRRGGARRSRTVTVRHRRCACPSPAAAAAWRVTQVAGARRGCAAAVGLGSRERGSPPDLPQGMRTEPAGNGIKVSSRHPSTLDESITSQPAKQNPLLKFQTKYFRVCSRMRIILKQVPQKTCLRYS